MNETLYSPDYVRSKTRNQHGQPLSPGKGFHSIASGATAIGLIGGFILLMMTHYSRHMTANGRVIPLTGLNVVGSPSDGSISSIKVKDGDKVVAGQVIMTLDIGTYTKSGSVAELTADKLGIEKSIIERRRNIKIEVYNNDRRDLQSQIGINEQRLHEVREALRDQRDTIAEMESELRSLRLQRKLGLSTNQQLQSQLSQLAEAKTSLNNSLNNEIECLNTESDLFKKIAELPQSLSDDILQLHDQLVELDEKLISNEPHHYVDIVAPINGIASGIAVHMGDEVRSRQNIATVLPASHNLVAEVFVDDAGAAHIQPNGDVQLELAAFPAQRYGLFNGNVISVSRSPAEGTGAQTSQSEHDTAEKQRSSDDREKYRYRVLVRMDAESVFFDGQMHWIPPGSAVTAHVAIERRPLIQWMLDPMRSVKIATTDFSQ